jgi:hypothetical protein
MTVPRLTALAAAALVAPATAQAGERARFLHAPAAAKVPAARLAVQYDLRFRLPQGQGLARLLLDAGVDRDDAAAAARLAAGHMGDGLGGCDAEVSIAKAADGSGLRLVRATLMTAAGQTVIERHGADLTIASETPARKFPRLV